MNRLLCTLMLLAPCLGGSALAADFQSPETIRQTAAAAVPGAGTAGFDVDAVVDPALRMPSCAEILRGQPATSGTVEVICPGATGWRLYVPVRVRRQMEVLVLQQALAPGEALGPGAVALETRDVGRTTGVLTDAAAVAGFSLRRPLAAGAIITSADLVSPRLVRRGDSVTLVARAGGIEVRAVGRAMTDAGVGERLNVENLSSRRMLQGVVLAGGEVEVGR